MRLFLPRPMKLAQSKKKKQKHASTKNDGNVEERSQLASCSVSSHDAQGSARATVAKSGCDTPDKGKVVVERRKIAFAIRRGRTAAGSRWSNVDPNVKSTDSKALGAWKAVESDTPGTSRNVSRSSDVSGEWFGIAVPTQHAPARWARCPTPTGSAVKSSCRSATQSRPSPQGSTDLSRGMPSQRNTRNDSTNVCANTSTEDILKESRKDMTALCDDTSQGFMRSITGMAYSDFLMFY